MRRFLRICEHSRHRAWSLDTGLSPPPVVLYLMHRFLGIGNMVEQHIGKRHDSEHKFISVMADEADQPQGMK